MLTLRRHRGCDRGRIWFPATQRLVVLQFPTREDAEAWDAAGQPIDLQPIKTKEFA